MKLVLLLLFVGVAVASRKPNLFGKEEDDTTKQREMNKLFSGLTDIDPNHKPVPFRFNETRFFKNDEVLYKFMDAWEEGFITKDSFFSLYHYKNRHDTYRFFDILYYARNYDIFHKIAQWARYELHPLQFVYGLSAAIIHRTDMSGVRLPNFYEVLPQYFMASDIVQGAYKASILGIKERRFDVNNTGHEYSWYKGKTLDSYKSGPKWNLYDMESRISYFTEDVKLADFIAKTTMANAPWISDEKYPTINQTRKGESLFHFYRHLLAKYNLERYANDMPPVKPLNLRMPIKTGYNPRLVTLHGHPFTPRPDGLVPIRSNPQGVHRLFITKRRYDDVADLLSYKNPLNNSYMRLEDNYIGLNRLGELVYGSTHPHIRAVYKPYHYQAFETMDKAVRASNAVESYGSVLSNYLTEVRDPIYFRVLATVNQVFENYFAKLPPYTPKELGFPGVKIIDFKTSPLQTYFENHIFEITNAVPLQSYAGYNYTASKTRLSYNPFTFELTLNSDKSQDVIVRIYITPSLDANNRELSIEEKVQQAVPLFFEDVDVKKGQHTIKGDSMNGFYSDSMRQTSEPMRSQDHHKDWSPKTTRCSLPSNLKLPKGGKPYTVFIIVRPYTHPRHDSPNPCNWDMLYGIDEYVDFPTNRRVIPTYFQQLDNIFFDNMTITHYDENYPHAVESI